MSPEENKTETHVEDATEGGETAGTTEKKSSEKREIEVSIDTSNLEDIVRRLKEQEEKSAKLTKQLEEATSAKGKVEKELEEKKDEAEEMHTKLTMIAEKEFTSKKNIIMEEAKKLIKDEERLKKIEEGIKDVDDLKATSFMIETLSTAMKEGEAAHKEQLEKEEKEAKAASEEAEEENEAKTDAEPAGKGGAGQATLAQATGGTVRKEYDSNEAMIRDLRRRSHSEDPEIRAEAQAILDELFLKWGRAVRAEYDGRYRPISVKKKDQPKISDITKEGGAAMPNPKARKLRGED
jgi:chromosome segregation ATPase